MNTALAKTNFDLDPYDFPSPGSPDGAQSLLALQRAKPSYPAQSAALILYALALVAAITYTARPTPPVQEDALELVMLPPVAPEELPAPVEEPPPPIAEEVPPETVDEPPPPVAEEPAVAPVEPKPVPKPKPKPKVVERKAPAEQPRHAPQAAAPARTGPTNVPPNAIASGYANQVHARIAHAAASVVPRAALARHESGRVGYRIVISPSGAVVSQSISPSGNAAFDAAATQALARAAPFPATGMTRPASLSGAIVFR
ncbi:TonB family protein [Methylocapsa acidiphila]|uniref:TonB family protein n=1 Tax=Methylocapsa acidiphila TaxID=133552 RepID=UPI0004221513|nr:TonB family protein [Methylocapsa acidiphila]